MSLSSFFSLGSLQFQNLQVSKLPRWSTESRQKEVFTPSRSRGGTRGSLCPTQGEEGQGCSPHPPGRARSCHPREQWAAFSGAWGKGGGACHPLRPPASGLRELLNLFNIPVIHQQLPEPWPPTSSRAGMASPCQPPLQGPGAGAAAALAVPCQTGCPAGTTTPPALAAAEQGDCYPRSSHGGNHLFANKTSILEASLTLGHSPS